MKAKSSPTVKQAALQAFNALPDTFRGNDLHRLVRMITRRSRIHTDSSIRKLHVLRQNGEISFERVGRKEDSLYRKI